ncbi:TonB-dependent receptor [Porticoccaceae bacterium LTM1]|nr:TonB-dependent receptor [Porticoccaceae bacterium LTM1]
MNRSDRVYSKKRLSLAVAATLSLSTVAFASASDERMQLNIKSQKATPALLELSKKTGSLIIVEPGIESNSILPAIVGELTLVEALDILLTGSGLTYQVASDGSIVVASEENGKNQGGEEKAQEKNEVEEVVVTGSRLVQDPGKLTRQVTVISREELEASGMSRLDEYLRRLPQNVNAPTNVASGTFESGATFGRGKNVYAGSGVNLRGLGEQYTLVLIDGRRPAKGGLYGDVADISSIPVDQVERIEILYDGAAAIYGADAVGGVINIITNREFEGTQVSVDVTRTEDGGADELNFGLGHTFNFDNGSLTINGNYLTRDPLAGTQREIQFTPLPAAGQGFALSNDEGLVLHPSSPANIGTGFSYDQVLMFVKDVDGDGKTDNEALNERVPGGQMVPNSWGGTRRIDNTPPDADYLPVYTLQLPDGAGLDALSLYDIVENTSVELPVAGAAFEEILTTMRARFPLGENSYQVGKGYSLLPEDDTISGGLSYTYDFSKDLRVNLAARYSKSSRQSATRNDAHQDRVLANVPNNPFFSHFLFNYTDDLPQTTQKAETENRSLSGGIDYDLNPDWSMQFGFGVSESERTSDKWNSVDGSALRNAVNGRYYDSDLRQYVENGLGYFKPYFGYSGPEEYVSALTIPFIHTSTETKSLDMDISVTGVLATLPAGDMRTNVILSHAETSTNVYSEKFSDTLSTGAGYTGGVTFNEQTERKRTGLGVELSAPVIDSLLMNVNGRYEQYGNIDESALNWAAGLNWEPVEWMTVRLNRTHSTILPNSMVSNSSTRLISTSFYLRDEARNYLPGYPRVPAYYISGGRDGLRPETNFGTSLGFIFRPLDGMEVQLNLTESNTSDRIGKPNVNTAYTPSELLPESIVNNPALYQVQNGRVIIDDKTWVERTQTARQTAEPLIDGAYVFDLREANMGAVSSRSADFRVRYRASTDLGDWFLTYTHQYTFEHQVDPGEFCLGDACTTSSQVYDFSSRTVIMDPTDTPFDQVGNIDRRLRSTRGYYPLPEHRGALDISWTYRGLSANVQTSIQSETSIIEEEYRKGLDSSHQYIYRTNLNRITTKAATPVNFNLGYDFSGDLFSAPRWLSTTRINFQINNLFYFKAKVSREVLSQEFEPDEFEATRSFSPYGVDPYGRTMRLKITTTF